MQQNTIFDKLGGRKFILSSLSLILGVVVVATGNQLSLELVSLIVGVLATFSGSNVMVSRSALQAGAGQNAGETEALQPSAPAFDETRIANIEQTLSQVGVTVSNTNKLLAAALNAGQPR